MTDGEAWAIEDEQRRLIVDAAENGMFVVDQHGLILLANAEAERIFGYAPGGLAGRSVDILGHAEIDAAWAILHEPSAPLDPLQVSAARGDLTARRADGSTIPIEVAWRSMRTGRGRLALITVGDVAQRRRTQQRRPTPSSREEYPIDSVASAERPGHIGRWRFDAISREVVWSQEMDRIAGILTPDSATLDGALAIFDPDDRARIAALVERAVTAGVPYRDEARIVRPDGSTRTVVHGGDVERSADGAISALVGFLQDVTELKNAQRERQRLSEYVTLANQAGKIGIWELDLLTNVSVWDRNMYALYGITDVLTVPTFEMWKATLHPHDRERALREIKDDIAGGAPSDSEFRVIWQNGEIHHIRSLATAVRDAAGIATRIIGTDWDVTEIRSLGDQLREEKDALISSEARYRALTEAMPQMVWVIDAAAQFEYVNHRWSQYTGLSLERSRKMGLTFVIDAADAASINAKRDVAPPREFECEARIRRSDGTSRWHLVRTVPFHDATGDAGKWIISATDIEERKIAEKTLAATVAELEHLAHHDSMTNLPNRMRLMDRLSQAIAQARLEGDEVIVLYIDLDRFKAINDTMGHAAGDCVLKETSLRIIGTLRATDTASRVGGDEFVVVCAASGGDEVEQIATRLLRALTLPIDVGGDRITIEASIGVSVFPSDGFDADTLIRKADVAMYAAKQRGRNSFRRYSIEAHTAIVAAAEFEAALRHGISAGELVVHYQPIIDLRTGRPIAAEALVRWQHPTRGLLPPGDFIAFAEERGLVAPIGDVVLEEACALLERLQRSGRNDISIAVNVSAHQFGKAGFIESIMAALERRATDPRRLVIEITESVVMGSTRTTVATLQELKNLGVSLSMDDFGTGYSSLAYIKNFPINTLKIDRSFVRDIAEDQTDQAIAKTIITLAHSLGMNVVAEGVETEAQLAILQSFGADRIQGYFFSRPLVAADFERFIATYGAPAALASQP